MPTYDVMERPGPGTRDPKRRGSGDSSVLELQRKATRAVAVQRLLDPSITAGFMERAAAVQGKEKSGFFRTPTYKKIKTLLSNYVGKQGGKPVAWREAKIATLDGLVESWLSKKKNREDTSNDGLARMAAVKWLQPQIQAELAGLKGGDGPTGGGRKRANAMSQPGLDRAEEVLDDTPKVEDAPEAPRTWQRGTRTGDGGSGPKLGGSRERPRGWVRGKIAGREDPKPKVTQAPEEVPEEEPVAEEKEKVSEESETASSQTIDSNEKWDDQRDDEKDSDKQDESDESVTPLPNPQSISGSLNTNQKLDQQFGNLESWADLSAETRAKKQKAWDVAHEDDDRYKRAKWGAVKERDDEYEGEFAKGSHHLADIWQDLLTVGKITPKRKPGEKPQIGRDRTDIKFARTTEGGKGPLTVGEMALYMEKYSGWRWPKRTFYKYWPRLKQMGELGNFPSVPPKKKPNDISDVDDDSDDTPPSKPSDEPDPKAEPEAEKAPDDPNAIKVKEKKGEERGKYRIDVKGGVIYRGDEQVPLDTSNMATNKSGKGWGIFVMSRQGTMFVGSHKVAVFHHSSFLAGGDVAGAGEMQIRGGKLKAVTNKSGHYKPETEQNIQVIKQLKDYGIMPSSYKFTSFEAIDEHNMKQLDYDSAGKYLNAHSSDAVLTKRNKQRSARR